MEKKRVIVLLAASLLSVVGCTHFNVKVTYYSDPPGATVYEGARVLGRTPVTIFYPISNEYRHDKYVQLRGARAVWASGASASIKSLTLDRTKGNPLFHNIFEFTFVRPDLPGREVDANFALQLEALREQKRAQDLETFLGLYNTVNQSKGINCVSRQVGNYVYTDCR